MMENEDEIARLVVITILSGIMAVLIFGLTGFHITDWQWWVIYMTFIIYGILNRYRR